jgi:hypothetical protein
MKKPSKRYTCYRYVLLQLHPIIINGRHPLCNLLIENLKVATT